MPGQMPGHNNNNKKNTIIFIQAELNAALQVYLFVFFLRSYIIQQKTNLIKMFSKIQINQLFEVDLTFCRFSQKIFSHKSLVG